MTVLPDHTEVLIVGAGPTGLSLAINLRRHGVDCLVVDSLEAPMPWSRALGLHARTHEYLSGMGVLEEVLAQSRVQKRLSVHNDRGRLADIDLTRVDSRFPWLLMLPQVTLEDILAARFEALGGRLARGVTLADFEQRDEQVHATLSVGEETRTISAQLMVGCDGAHSRVRETLGFAFEGVRYPDHFLLCDVEIDWPLAADSSHAFLLPEGSLLALPLPDCWRLIMNQPLQRDTRMEQLSLAPFSQRLAQALGEAPAMGEARWISGFSIHRRLVSRYRLNRVLLAGDACHIQSPIGAQGMNTGIADACNLAWKIALFLDGIGGGGLLDSYEAERRPVARQMLSSVDMLSKGVLSRGSLLRGARDSLLRALASRPALTARLMRRASQLNIDYRESPIVHEVAGGGRSGVPRAGDRMPTLSLAPLEQPDSHFDVQALLEDTRHQLLIVLPDPPDHAALVAVFALCDRVPQEYGRLVRVTVVIQGASLPALNELKEFPVNLTVTADERLGARLSGAGGLWLLRPDGHVGFHGELGAATECLDWLSQFFARR